MSVKHGVYVYETGTALTTPITAPDSVQVAVGVAPVFMLDDPAAVTNKPILCANATEAMDKLGYVNDFANYGLCQTMYVNSVLGIGPIVFINVLDVSTMRKGTADSVTLTAPIAYKIVVDKVGAIKSTVSIVQGETSLTAGTDFTLSYNEDGKLVVDFIPGSTFDPSKNTTVTCTLVDLTAVNAAAVVGSYNASTGVATGIELMRYVYPRLGVVPSILTAPGLSQISAVGIALAAKAANLNGVFKAMAVLDIDTTVATAYTGVQTTKNSAGYTSPFCYPVWPSLKVGERVISGSVVVSAVMAYTDVQHGGVPSRTPSNKVTGLNVAGTCLADGTEILLDQDQGTTVNGYGVATFINLNGWRIWGSYTGAYPLVTDVKDMWVPVRRMFNWQANNFILSYFSKVDDPLNQVLVESVVDSENIRCNAFAPDHWAGARIQFLTADNPVSDLLAGKIVFRQSIAPYTPAQEIDNILSYDTALLEASFEGLSE